LANRVITSRPVEPTLLIQPATFKRPVLIVEAHSRDEHLRAERQIIEATPRQPRLAAMNAPEPADDSLYAGVLQAVSAKESAGQARISGVAS
jgi:hypothetical protein